jgi:hypothetical protein
MTFARSLGSLPMQRVAFQLVKEGREDGGRFDRQ